MYYYISGTIIESNIKFPELTESKSKEADIKFYLSQEKFSAPDCMDWFSHISLQNGEEWLRFGRTDTGYVLSFVKIAYFIIDTLNKSIKCFYLKKIPLNVIRFLFINHVIPQYLSLKGNIILHCSCVSIKQKAIAFIGRSSAGKSTLASAFCRNGYELITDDFLLVKKIKDSFFAIPSYGGIKLSSISKSKIFNDDNIAVFKNTLFTDKHWLNMRKYGGFSSQKKIKISRIYIINSINENENINVDINKASVKDSFSSLLENILLPDSKDKKIVKDHFGNCAELLNSGLIRTLRYKINYDILSSVIQRILNDFETDGDL